MSVREALVTSVAWDWPPVSFQISQLSMVPKAISPRTARRRRPLTLSKSHLIFVPEKYVSRTRPVFRLNVGAYRDTPLQISAVRRHCQTIARWTGLPEYCGNSL